MTMMNRWAFTLATMATMAQCFHNMAPLGLHRRSHSLSSVRRQGIPVQYVGQRFPRERAGLRSGATSVSAVAEGVAAVQSIGALLAAADLNSLGWVHDWNMLADAATAAAVSASEAAATSAAAATDAGAAAAATTSSGGTYDAFVNLVEQSLISLHSALLSHCQWIVLSSSFLKGVSLWLGRLAPPAWTRPEIGPNLRFAAVT